MRNWGSSISPPIRLKARGRSERAFRTLQDRLPKELALAGVKDVEAANAFIREVYLPAHNARFAVEPTDKASAFVPVAEAQWRDILCVQDERVVALDNTVAWNGQAGHIIGSALSDAANVLTVAWESSAAPSRF